MDDSLLVTKLHIPRLSTKLVSRPRHIELSKTESYHRDANRRRRTRRNILGCTRVLQSCFCVLGRGTHLFTASVLMLSAISSATVGEFPIPQYPDVCM